MPTDGPPLPDPKSRTLARGPRKYRRKVASPKQWQAIIAAKRGPCRVCPNYATYNERIEFHHIVPRDLGGDDLADNIVPLHPDCHALVTVRHKDALLALAESLTDEEYAYVVAKLGEGGM